MPLYYMVEITMHPFISLQNLRLAEDFFLKCKWFYTLAIVVNKSFQNPKKKQDFFLFLELKVTSQKRIGIRIGKNGKLISMRCLCHLVLTQVHK